MIALGLSSVDLKLFNQSLTTHHSVKITVMLLSLTHSYLSDLSGQLLDGQVSIDADAEITRSLTLQLYDPEHSLKIDSSAPSDGALFYDRMIRIVYSVKSELLPRWVDVPVFTGPISKMSRNADVLNIECQGKESLLAPPTVANTSHTFGKGWRRTDLIKSIMGTFGGENRFSIPDYSQKTAAPVVMKGNTNLWQLAKAVSGAVAARQLFYDGRGFLCLRGVPATATYTFRTGSGGNVTTVPTVEYDIANVRNVVKVTGAVPKGKKTPVVAVASLPRSHPLNHMAMGRNARPRALLEEITDDNLKTTGQAQAVANARVRALGIESVDVKFDALVAPHLEPMDLYTLKTPDLSMTGRLRQMTIPLKSAVSSMGYLTKSTPNRARIRR